MPHAMAMQMMHDGPDGLSPDANTTKDRHSHQWRKKKKKKLRSMNQHHRVVAAFDDGWI